VKGRALLVALTVVLLGCNSTPCQTSFKKLPFKVPRGGTTRKAISVGDVGLICDV
jgi:hypothetical protein